MPKQTKPKLPQQLPPCDGPKLQAFKHKDLPIEWLDRLDTGDNRGSNIQGYVFRARIGGQEYAIKVFKFFNPNDFEHYWGALLGKDTPLTTAAFYMDPFYKECRAYGQIQQAIKRGTIKPTTAVRCHGFILLDDKDARTLQKRNVDFEFDKVDLEYRQIMEEKGRVRAIVKDVGLQHHGVEEKNLRKILKGIISLNKIQIYNRDIRLDNYRNGQLVDFGSSWTEPHALLNALSDREVLGIKLADRELFDEMVEENEIPNKREIRGRPNAKYQKKLRSWTAKQPN